MLSQIAKISAVRIYHPKDLRSADNRHVVRKSIDGVLKRFPDGVALLDPVKDMHIKEEEFKKIVRVEIFGRERWEIVVNVGWTVARRLLSMLGLLLLSVENRGS